jgi:curved DNA-binding protein CbpA
MPEPPPDDFYETLQVSPRADAEVIEAAYRVLARRYHPDRDPSPGATERMARINQAWEALGQPETRERYDRERLAAHVSPNGNASASVAGGPELALSPDRLALALRRGEARTVTVAVQTDLPGIRVDAAVTAGESWLTVQPTTLRGLEEDRVSVGVHTHGLAPGWHRGTVSLATSWETRALSVQLRVRKASPLFRLQLLLGRLRRRVLLPALLLLLVLAVALVAAGFVLVH